MCLPDVAMLVSIVALFFSLFLGDGPEKLFRDSDKGWHIRNGEAMLKKIGRGRLHKNP